MRSGYDHPNLLNKNLVFKTKIKKFVVGGCFVLCLDGKLFMYY
jgi:hypothetical protein